MRAGTTTSHYSFAEQLSMVERLRRAGAARGEKHSSVRPNPRRWQTLGNSGVRLATALVTTGGSATGLAIAMARELIDVDQQHAEAELLSVVAEGVATLQDAPLKTARLHLKDAAGAGTENDVENALELARQSLYSAHGTARSDADRALIELYIGLVWLGLEKQEQASEYLSHCLVTLDPLIDAAADAAEVRRRHAFFRFTKTEVALTIVFNVYFLGYKLVRDVVRRERAVDESALAALVHLQALGAAAAETLNVLVPRAKRVNPDLGLGAAPGLRKNAAG